MQYLGAWQVIAEIFGKLAWHTSQISLAHWPFLRPQVSDFLFLRASAPVKPSSWMAHFHAFSHGWSSNKSPWNIAHWVKNCWPRYFPNPPGSVKRANGWLYSVYSDFSKVCFFSTLPALFQKQNPGMSRSKQSWNYQIHGQSTALRSAK